MIDIEFISAKNPQIRASVLYQFTHCEYKKDVLDRIINSAKDKEYQLREVDYSRVLPSIVEPSLLGDSLVYVDMNKLYIENPKGYGKTLEDIYLQIKRKSFSNRLLLILKLNSKGGAEILSCESTDRIKKSATFIEEITLEKSNISKAVKYILDKNYLNDLDNLAPFKSCLEEVYLTRDMTLPRFNRKVDEMLITCISGNKFNSNFFRNFVLDPPAKYMYQLHDLLFDFLQKRDRSSKSLIIKELETLKVKEGATTKSLIYKINSILIEFILVNREFEDSKPDNISTYRWGMLSRYKSLKLINLLKFQLLFSEGEPKLNQSDFLFSVNYLLIMFLK